jgi:integrase
MASLIRRPGSPYWIACYTAFGADGRPRQLKRSTKTGDKGDAWTMANSYEAAYRKTQTGDSSEAQIRRVMHELIEQVTGKKSIEYTVRSWLTQYLARENGTVSEDTMIRYRQVIGSFLDFLGAKADARLGQVTVDDLVAFRDKLSEEGRSARTVNLTLKKFLNRPFRLAAEERLIERNVVAQVKPLKGTDAKKGTFDGEQLERLLAVAKADWKGLILAAFYTGARLGDLVKLTWENVDLATGLITFNPQKTEGRTEGNEIPMPIHPQLLDHLIPLCRTDNPRKPVFPTLYNKPGTGRSGLSQTFKALMAQAKIDPGVAREKKKGGVGRNVSRLSFHSLRHTFNSALAAGGVNSELRQELAGHSSAETNRVYTHTELQVKKDAIAKLPRLKF